jgi:hypothetical protein
MAFQFNGVDVVVSDSEKLNGAAESTSATANTIVKRDASGRITAVAASADGDVVIKSQLPGVATSTTAGLVELYSDTTQSIAANAVSSTASRTYGIQKNSAGQAVVNVPWVDTNTTYSAGNGISLSGTTFTVAAGNGLTQEVSGLAHADTSSVSSVNNSGNTFIQDLTFDTYGHVTAVVSGTASFTDTNTTYILDGSGTTNSVDIELIAGGSGSGTDTINVVGSGATTVAWDEGNQRITISSTDTNTTYSKATTTTLGLVKVEDAAVQTTAANAVSSTASRTYGIQLNSSDQLVVNVPWVDTKVTVNNTLTSTSTTEALSAAQGKDLQDNKRDKTDVTFSGAVLNGGYTEDVYAITGSTPTISPGNGSIQTWTLAANSTPALGTWGSGQSITMLIDDGESRTVDWSSLGVDWKTEGGESPTLNTDGYTHIVLWKVGSVIFGARVGDA